MFLPNKIKAASIQRIATFIGSLSYLNFGLMFGITPEHTRLYQTLETPLERVIGETEADWIAGSVFLCAAVGALASGVIVNSIGPKSVLLLSGLLQIISWFSIHFAYDILHIYGSRIAAGFSAGSSFLILPIFITDIAQESNRATLIAIAEIGRAFGILLGFAIATFVHYNYVNIVGIAVSIAFNLTFPFVQESPHYFLSKRNEEGLEKSLRWYRGIRDLSDRLEPKFLNELKEFKATVFSAELRKRSKGERSLGTSVAPTQSVASSTIPSNSNYPCIYIAHLIFICLVLAIGFQSTGAFVLLNYIREIVQNLEWLHGLEEWGDAWGMVCVQMTLSAGQCIGAILAICIVEKINRRVLLIITTIASGLVLVCLVIVTKFGNSWPFIPFHTTWLPLGLLFLHFVVSNIGVYPLVSIIMLELLPVKFRVIFMSGVATLNWTVGFLLLRFFRLWVSSTVNLLICFSSFAGISILVGAFAIILLPETRHKSLEQIQQIMGVAKGSTEDEMKARTVNVKAGDNCEDGGIYSIQT